MRIRTRMRGCAAACAACLVGLALGSCSTRGGSEPTHTATVTVVASSSATSTPSHTASPTPSPTATLVKQLPGTCDSLLSQFDVQQATGLQLPGKTAFVVGVPEPNIGRIGYLNCRYGIAADGAPPQVEIGVSLYDSAAQAEQRLRGTVEDYAAHGANQQPATVGEHAGTLLTGGSGEGYAAPLLVVASGQRTVAVSAAASLTSAANLPTVLGKIAALALQRTGG